MWQQTEKPSSVTPKALSMGTELRDTGGPSGRGTAEPGGGVTEYLSGPKVFRLRSITKALGPCPLQPTEAEPALEQKPAFPFCYWG